MITPNELALLEERFPDRNTGLGAQYRLLAAEIIGTTRDSRQQTAALDRLEESLMWASQT